MYAAFINGEQLHKACWNELMVVSCHNENERKREKDREE